MPEAPVPDPDRPTTATDLGATVPADAPQPGATRAGDDDDGTGAGEHDGDSLPADLDASTWVGPYTFPNITRRRWPAGIYAAAGVICLALYAAHGGDGVLVNGGYLAGGIGLLIIAAYHLQAAFDLKTRDVDALASAAREIDFPIGHASAQLGWRGLRSRPTWRILIYSAEEPPLRRGLVLVDGVDGRVVDHFLEDNPEDWTKFNTSDPAVPADT